MYRDQTELYLRTAWISQQQSTVTFFNHKHHSWTEIDKKLLSFAKHWECHWDSPASCSAGNLVPSPKVKRPERGSDHYVPYSIKAKIECSCRYTCAQGQMCQCLMGDINGRQQRKYSSQLSQNVKSDISTVQTTDSLHCAVRLISS